MGIFTTPTPAAQQEIPAASLLINEVMAQPAERLPNSTDSSTTGSNSTTNRRQFLDLARVGFLQRRSRDPTRYRFRTLEPIPPKYRRTVSVSSGPTGNPEKVLHATFGLSASGDCVPFYKPDAIAISDNVCIGAAVSYGCRMMARHDGPTNSDRLPHTQARPTYR